MDGTLEALQLRILGIGQEKGLINWCYRAVDESFPPGNGGGDGVAYGGKGKGILIHTVTEGSGMPLSNRTTDANGSETDQVIPLVDSVKLKTNKRGISPKPLKVVAADKAYYSKNKRAVLGRRRIRPQ